MVFIDQGELEAMKIQLSQTQARSLCILECVISCYYKLNMNVIATWESFLKVLYHSSGLMTLAWSKLLVFTSKKLTLRFYSYMFEYRPLPLTSFPRPPRAHLTSHT